MLFSLISIIIPYLFIYLKSNPSKIQRPNLTFNLKNFTILFYSFKYYFSLISIVIPYLFIYLFKVQSFKSPTFKFNFQSQNFHYSISLIKILCLLIIIIISYVFICPLLKISFIKVQSFKNPMS